LLYVAATRAKERLVIPVFAEKGERLDILKAGIANDRLVVRVCGVRELAAGVVGENGKAAASRRTPDAAIVARRTWAADRAALLERVSRPATQLSPSKLTDEEEPTGLVRARAMELGVLVHEALERGSAEGLPANAAEWVTRALQSDLLKRAGKAAECYRELPFAVDGMEGKMDLLFREGSRWTLVDFKTDALVEPENYRAQMRAYVDALNTVAGIAVNEVVLYYVAFDKPVALP
jgi:ATP-dependent exoDNAse (exonuclease V) beta subunit